MLNPIKKISEHGDFQTPTVLTDTICRCLSERKIRPQSILEPICGKGNFIFSSIRYFPGMKYLMGIELNQDYIEELMISLERFEHQCDVEIIQGNFFQLHLESIVNKLTEPISVIGNPPWVTNSSLSTLNSLNLPPKQNLFQLSGMDALTG